MTCRHNNAAHCQGLCLRSQWQKRNGSGQVRAGVNKTGIVGQFEHVDRFVGQDVEVKRVGR